MQIQSQRSKEIENEVSKPENKVGQWPLEIGGKVKKRDYYKLPITILRFNTNNGRLAMEIREWERNHKKSLDANDKNDEKVIRELLLSLDKVDTDLLKEDLKQKLQIEPGVVTHDGFVINGNRRMALLQLLHDEEPSGKWEKFEAIILPPDIDNKDLWRIEAGLQLSKDKTAEYHPVNELLKIKEGKDAGLEPKEIAAAMYGRTSNEVEQALERLNIITGFLEYCNQKENFGLIKTFGLHEHFIDIQKTILATARRNGEPSKVIQKRLIQTFAFLKAGTIDKSRQQGTKKKSVTHWDVRDLGKIFADGDAEHEFSKVFEDVTKSNKKNHPLNSDLILDAYQTAKEVLSNKADRGKPIVLIERATKALDNIDRKSKHLKEEKVKDAFSKLSKVINELSKEINK